MDHRRITVGNVTFTINQEPTYQIDQDPQYLHAQAAQVNYRWPADLRITNSPAWEVMCGKFSATAKVTATIAGEQYQDELAVCKDV